MTTTTEMPINHLAHLTQLAQRAYNWTSFDPEKRGQRTLLEFDGYLTEDLTDILKHGANDEQIERYKKAFENKFSSWLHSESNCASSVITGGSNFPAQRMQKRRNWAEGHLSELLGWRKRVKEAYARNHRKEQQKIKEEMHGGQLGIARMKLANLERYQEMMKDVNAAHKAFLKNPNTLELSELSENLKLQVIQYVPKYSWEPHPYAPYMLTNNSAEIRRMKSKVEELERKEAAKEKDAPELIFDGGKILINAQADRIQILYDQKPDFATITNLKKNGFKWSPTNKAWQRFINDASLYAAKKVTNTL